MVSKDAQQMAQKFLSNTNQQVYYQNLSAGRQRLVNAGLRALNKPIPSYYQTISQKPITQKPTQQISQKPSQTTQKPTQTTQNISLLPKHTSQTSHVHIRTTKPTKNVKHTITIVDMKHAHKKYAYNRVLKAIARIQMSNSSMKAYKFVVNNEKGLSSKLKRQSNKAFVKNFSSDLLSVLDYYYANDEIGQIEIEFIEVF